MAIFHSLIAGNCFSAVFNLINPEIASNSHEYNNLTLAFSVRGWYLDIRIGRLWKSEYDVPSHGHTLFRIEFGIDSVYLSRVYTARYNSG